MPLDVSTEHIEIVQGSRGPKARIRGSRIRVIDIVDWYEGAGWSVDKIIGEFPQLSKSEIFAALAYYWDHREEIEAKRADDEAFVEEVIRRNPSQLAEKLKQRHVG
ncbi:MAG: DUF433 domain-containing protein [Chloroflexota bacterium]